MCFRRAHAGEILRLDVRPEEEYRYAHIKGAASIPLKQLKRRIADLPKDLTIVAYCRGPYCVLSQEAVKLQRKKGLKAYRIPDAVQDWQREELSERSEPGQP
jgi:rhodanese-related sulfurtransferase